MQRKYEQLKTNFFINILKLAISIPACLFAAGIGLMEWRGGEYIISLLLISLVFHFYRLRYEKTFSIKSGSITVKVDSNFIGYKIVRITHSKFGINEIFKTRESNYNYSNDEKGIKVDIIFAPEDDPRPIARINER